MANDINRIRKKDSARLIWDTKPRRAPNPKDIEFQTAEVVIPNPQQAGQLPLSFRDGLFGEKEIDSQADYSHQMVIEGNDFTKEPSVIERLAYKDTWAGGTDSYLDMLYPRLQLMKRLLQRWEYLDTYWV